MLLLQCSDVFHESDDAHIAHIFVLPGLAEDRAPDGHVARAVLEQSVRIGDGHFDGEFGILAFVVRGQLRKIGWRFFNASAAGPLPLASTPWHTAQYWLKRSLPSSELIMRAGTSLIVFVCALAATQPPNPMSMTDIRYLGVKCLFMT